MRFAVFDHMDRGAVSLREQYEQRLRLLEAYDAHGFDGYHIAEHHATPLVSARRRGVPRGGGAAHQAAALRAAGVHAEHAPPRCG